MSVGVLLRLLRLPFDYGLFAIACLVPKRRNLWLLGAWDGRRFADNPKYVYRYLLAQRPDIQVVWIAKTPALQRQLAGSGLPVARATSLRGLWMQIRARLVVFTHSVVTEYFAPAVGAGTRRVQTWHGIPMKKIGYDYPKVKRARLKARLRAILMPFQSDACDLVIAGGQVDAERYATAFNVRPVDIRITGFPRNDDLWRSSREARLRGAATPRRALYAPTFRGAVGSEFGVFRTSGFDFAAFDERLRGMGFELRVKLHPVQVFAPGDRAAIESSQAIRALPADTDIYEEAEACDVLITDFSSIVFDFLITGKPVIMAPLDRLGFLTHDGELYDPYEEMCAEAPCATWADVLDRLAGLPTGAPVPSQRYQDLQARFHRFLDDGSSRRVVAELDRLAG